MKFTHIRHGSHLIEFKGRTFLVDPVLANMGTTFALPKGRVNDKNPLVELPFDTSFIKDIHGVFITHMHFDHFDEVAKELIPPNLPIYCHPSAVRKIKKSGFTNIHPIDGSKLISDDIDVRATGGKHGFGLIGLLMGRTTGYIISDICENTNNFKTYIIGDSIWYDYIDSVVEKNKPDVIIVFAGEARLPIGKAITMSTTDIDNLALKTENSKIVIIHLDSWNHCFLTRAELKAFVMGKKYENRIFIPDDGETIVFD